MGWSRGVPLVPVVCTLISYGWLATAIERHSYAENPGPLSIILLGVSGLALRTASKYSQHLPDDNISSSTVLSTLVPERALVVGLAILVVLRLAALSFVIGHFECSKPGVEYFLPLLIASCTFLLSLPPPAPPIKKFDDPEDMSRTLWDDIASWLWSPEDFAFVIGVTLATVGPYLSARPVFPSTVFCSTLSDSPGFTVGTQYVGVVLDAVILVAVYTILLSAKTLSERLETLGKCFAYAATGVVLAWLSGIFFHSESSASDLELRHLLTLAVDGIFLAIFLGYSSIICPSDGPLSPCMAAIFLSSSWASFSNIEFINGFQAISRQDALMPYILTCAGMGLWLASGRLTTSIILRGVLIIATLAAVLSCIAISSFTNSIISSHPLRTRVYRARIEQDRWLRYSAISQSLKVAVSEYQERHGHEPPPNFDKWYQFANDRNSVIVDHFEQIRRDMAPFLSMSKEEVSQRVKEAALLPNMETVLVRGGRVTSQSEDYMVRGLEHMVQKFSEYLPDMDIPVNLGTQPRVLAPWSESGRLWRDAAQPPGLSRRGQHKTELREENQTQSRNLATSTLSPAVFRHMIAETCPPLSPTRAGYHWDQRDLCLDCVRPQSKAQFIRYHPRSLEPCHQPDLLRQHDFYLSPPTQKPATKLLPVFSRAKTDSFSDILIPIQSRARDPNITRADNKPFSAKKDTLYWRGSLPHLTTHDGIHAGHTARLLHLIHNTTKDDTTTSLLIPTADHLLTGHFTYHRVSSHKLLTEDMLRLDVIHLSNPQASTSPPLPPAILSEFGPGRLPATPLDNRYILIMDESSSSSSPGSGPPPPGQLHAVLRSHSVPFVASIFREWYTERLYPWVHFVPIDFRWQGLMGSLSYFSGIKDKQRRQLASQPTSERDGLVGDDRKEDKSSEEGGSISWEWGGRPMDGEWIADQGRKWVDKVVREEDAEVYAFRVLLEWGRIVTGSG